MQLGPFSSTLRFQSCLLNSYQEYINLFFANNVKYTTVNYQKQKTKKWIKFIATIYITSYQENLHALHQLAKF